MALVVAIEIATLEIKCDWKSDISSARLDNKNSEIKLIEIRVQKLPFCCIYI